MDIQNLSQKHLQLPFQGTDLNQHKRQRVKDSLLLVIVFLIGLVGSCYILHFALSNDNGQKGYGTEINLSDETGDLALK